MAYTVHPFFTEPDTPPLFAIIADGEDGFVVGELHEVQDLAQRLDAFLAGGAHDGEISNLDERLGWRWLSVTEAAEQYGIAPQVITYNCREGYIRQATIANGRWRFPQATFLFWLNNRPKPGPKPAGGPMKTKVRVETQRGSGFGAYGGSVTPSTHYVGILEVDDVERFRSQPQDDPAAARADVEDHLDMLRSRGDVPR